MIKPSSNAPAPMQPWVRSTDKQISDLQNAIAQLQSMIGSPIQVNHEQNNALAQTFDFVEQTDGSIIANSSGMNFTGSVSAESDFSINGELSVGNPSRVILDQNTGEQIGVQPNMQIISGQSGVNPVTQLEYFDAGQMNIYDTSLNVEAYGQITGDGLSIALTNDGQVERQNIAIVGPIGATGDGTYETFYIENNASNVAVYTPGKYVTITGVEPAGYNTPKALILSVDTGISPMSFTIEGTATDTYVGGGYVTINQANSIYEGKLSVQGPGPNYNGTTVNQNGVFVGLNAGDSASATSYMNQTEVASPSAVITGTRVFVSNSQPTAVSDGDLWIDSSGKVPLTANDIPSNYASRNFILNGGMDLWQRGTTGFATNGVYSADRWIIQSSAGTNAVSRSTDIPSDIGVQYSLSFAGTSTTNPMIQQRIESLNAIAFAGKTVTLSFYAKSTAGSGPIKVSTHYPTTTDDTFGTFASPTVTADKTALSVSPSGNASTNWTRYSVTFDVSTLARRGYRIDIYRETTAASSTTLYAGIELELGSSVSPFARSGATFAQELSACQRYYFRLDLEGAAGSQRVAIGQATGTGTGFFVVPFPVSMRTAPTTLDRSATASHYQIVNAGGTAVNATNIVLTANASSKSSGTLTVSSTFTASGNASQLLFANAGAFLGFSAEL